MASFHFVGETLDDVMRSSIEAIEENGEPNEGSKGKTTELVGVLLEIANPRARLSRTETRGKPFSCLGELCWYLAGTNQLGFISYYLKHYKESAEGDLIFGGYGPRLFRNDGLDQLTNVTNLLRRKPGSRRAVIQLFSAEDLVEDHKDIPCTCTLQFMIRSAKLQMVTHMRSNDAFRGLPHDIFAFTMLQEILARSLSVDLGTYKHAVGSLHLYDENKNTARRFLDEGWQPTDRAMPPMPMGDPWPAIGSLLKAEAAIRNGNPLDASLEDLDAYWGDLVRLLQVLRCWKDCDTDGIEELLRKVSSPTYHPFIENKLRQCRRQSRQEASAQ